MPVERKKVAIGIGIGLAILIPVFMATGWGLSILSSIACRNAPSGWAASLQLGVADFYSVSLRLDEAKESYDKFYDTFKTHPRRYYAKYRAAMCLEKNVDAPRNAAIEAYQAFIEEFGGEANPSEELKELLQKAEKSISVLKVR
jgi:hypothetical protein